MPKQGKACPSPYLPYQCILADPSFSTADTEMTGVGGSSKSLCYVDMLRPSNLPFTDQSVKFSYTFCSKVTKGKTKVEASLKCGVNLPLIVLSRTSVSKGRCHFLSRSIDSLKFFILLHCLSVTMVTWQNGKSYSPH